LLKVPSFPDAVRPLTLAPDGSIVVAQPPGEALASWDLATGKRIDPFKGLPEKVIALAFAPDGRTLAALTPEGEVGLWAWAGKKKTATLGKGDFKDALAGALAFAPEGKTLAVYGLDIGDGAPHGHVQTWNLAAGKKLATFEFPRDGYYVAP